MKNILIIAAIALGSQALAQKTPEFIQGHNVVKEDRVLFEAPQPCWIVYGEDAQTFSDLFYKVVEENTNVSHQRLDNGELWVYEIGNDGLSCAIYVHDNLQSSSRLVFYYFAE